MARWSRRRDERGATAVLAAILLTFVLMTSAAFTVDLGQQRVVRSDMQAVADMASLDLSRLLTGGTVSSYSTSAFNTALANSLARNDSSYGDAVTSQGKCSSTGLATTVKAGACWEFADTSGTGEFTPTQTPTAVKVYARSETGFLFGGFTKVNAGGATRDATAAATSAGCFSLGSFALGIESKNSSLLTALFNNNLGISGQLVGYQGLAAADVSLLDLMAAAKVGTVSSLADVNVSTFFGDLAQSDVADSATLTLLRSISASSQLDPRLTVGDLIDLTGAGTDVLDSKVNLLDLVTNSLAVSNGANFINAPTGVTVPGLASLQVGLQVIERPRMACGTGEASTGQVRLQVRGTVLGLINLDLGVTVAQAKGTITGITCSDGAASAMEVKTYDQALVALQVKATVLSADPPEPQPTGTSQAGGDYDIDLSDSNYDNGVETNSGAVTVSTISLAALGLNLGVVANALLSPVLNTLATPLTSFLHSTLGITVAGATIWPMRTPTCGLPELVD